MGTDSNPAGEWMAAVQKAQADMWRQWSQLGQPAAGASTAAAPGGGAASGTPEGLARQFMHQCEQYLGVSQSLEALLEFPIFVHDLRQTLAGVGEHVVGGAGIPFRRRLRGEPVLLEDGVERLAALFRGDGEDLRSPADLADREEQHIAGDLRAELLQPLPWEGAEGEMEERVAVDVRRGEGGSLEILDLLNAASEDLCFLGEPTLGLDHAVDLRLDAVESGLDLSGGGERLGELRGLEVERDVEHGGEAFDAKLRGVQALQLPGLVGTPEKRAFRPPGARRQVDGAEQPQSLDECVDVPLEGQDVHFFHALRMKHVRPRRFQASRMSRRPMSAGGTSCRRSSATRMRLLSSTRLM